MLKVSARIFPIGYIISVDAPNFNPNDFYIGGNWERIKGRVIVGVDEAQTEFNTTGKMGGAKTHTLTIDEIPKHSHGQYTSDRGGKQPFTLANGGGANMPGYWYSSPNSYTGPQVLTSEVGNGNPHNNLPPYQTAYIWKLISYSD